MSKIFKKNITYYYDIICIVDFEATCHKEQDQHKDFVQEIIEFPALLVDVKQKQIVFNLIIISHLIQL
jgi:inhibitor of KinA sporulation pathway (predicted exonuclease)